MIFPAYYRITSRYCAGARHLGSIAQPVRINSACCAAMSSRKVAFYVNAVRPVPADRAGTTSLVYGWLVQLLGEQLDRELDECS